MKQISMRDAFFDRLYELAKKDRNIIVVSADMGAPSLDTSRLAGWMREWQAACQELTSQEIGSPQPVPARLHPLRQPYYLRAFAALLGSPQPENVLWPLLYTWTMAVNLLGEDTDFHQNWLEAMTQLNLAGPGFAERLAALNAYLDRAPLVRRLT